ncbi:LOW QUALITY PROTEIN: neural cell adhesion molecule L1 [Discoglossus pictus]
MAVPSGSCLLGTVLGILFCSTLHAINIPKGLRKPPTITDQSPEKYVVYPNDDIVLKCEATGRPKPEFSWTKDDVKFDPGADPRVKTKEGSGNLTISNTNGHTAKDLQGKYRCFANNSLGTAISHEINLITENMPKWQKEDIYPIEVEAGQSVILPCNPPKSAVPPRVHWMDTTLSHITQDQRISTGLDGNLYFSNVLASDEHPDYMCNAQFIGARTIVQKEAIALKVLPSNTVNYRAPLMMVPKGTSSTYLALKGTPLVLECIAEGLPTPDIEWEHVGSSIAEGHYTFDNFKKTLKITSVEENDDGEYQCTAKNTKGIIRHTYNVKVESAPYWVKEPESGMYGPGENVVLHCEVSGMPKPKVTWRINGEPVKDSDLGPNRKVTQKKLILNNVQTTDTMIVQCEAQNEHGTILSNAYVYVDLFPPQILTKDKVEYRVVENSNVSMHCKNFGAPVPKVVWEDAQMSPVLSDVRISQQTNGTLIISDVQREDSGIYYCTASNNEDNVTISAILAVKNATQIISPPIDQRLKRGDKAIFQCETLFDHTAKLKSVQWSINGVEVDGFDDDDKISIEDSTLSVSNVQEEDQGTYTCVASSDVDSVEREAELVVIDAPDAPFGVELTHQQGLGVSLVWVPGQDNNSPIEEFIIEFEENNFEPGRWHEVTRVDGDQISANLTLSPYVNYQFRVIAVNEIGPGASSEPSQRYETPQAAPKKNPSGVKGEGTQPNNMQITWKPLKGIDWNGPGLQYIVKWRRQTPDKGLDWVTKRVSSPPVMVEDTETFVPYEIKVQCINDLGEAPEPKSIIGYSGEDYPTVTPENVGVELINRSLVKLQWNPVPKEGLNGHLLGYNLYYKSKHHNLLKHSVRHNDATITNLTPFTNYTVFIRVFNGRGEGPDSEIYKFATPEGVPSQPLSLRAERQSDTSLVVVWEAPESPNGILTGYVIRHQLLNKTHPGNTIIEEISDPFQMNWTLANISSNDTYRFYVSAKTSAGEGAPAECVGSTREVIELPNLMNITSITKENLIILQWNQMEGAKNTELKVQVTNSSSEATWYHHGSVNSSTLYYEMPDLLPGRSYFIRLVALNRSKDLVIWKTSVETSGPALINKPNDFATEGWFIGLISAIVLLLLILLILCFIKRSKGGKYSVKDKEDTQVDSEARPMKDETFGEYRSLESQSFPRFSDNDEKPFTSSQPSLNGDIKQLGSDDSLADYGGSVDVQFNEDGSFIGQYSGKKEKEAAPGNESSGATSPVNPNIPIE